MRMQAVAIATSAMLGVSAVAQALPGAMPRSDQSTGYHWHNEDLSQEDKNKLADYLDNWAQQKFTPEQKAQHKAAAAALVVELKLACDVDEAVPAAHGPATVNGRAVETSTYEVACSNGLGYFLVSQAPEAPYGISCFTAEATRQADAKAGRGDSAVCRMPQNADLNTTASLVLSRSGVACTVNGHKLIGQNSKVHIEFMEVTCVNGPGYILVTALPGSIAPPGAMSCAQAAAKGLPCTMAANAVAAAKP